MWKMEEQERDPKICITRLIQIRLQYRTQPGKKDAQVNLQR